MQTDKKIYIGLAVLIVIGGLIYWQSTSSKKELAARTTTGVRADTLPNFKLSESEAEAVSKLVIKEKDKDEVVVEKRGEQWWLTKPIEALASEQNVTATIDNLKSVQAEDTINATPQAPEMYKQYNLEDAEALHVTLFKGENGADKVYDAFFGKSGSRGQMARTGDNTGIFVVKGYSSFQFSREIKDWREKSILKFEDANVVSFSVRNEHGDFSFSKNADKWSGTFKGKAIDKFDQEKAKDMLRAYRSLSAQDFADDKAGSLDSIGLGDKPAATVSFVLKDDAGKPEIVFGTTTSDSGRYALKQGDKTVYVIGSWAADWATAKVDKFQTSSDKKDDADKSPSGSAAEGDTPVPPSKE